MSEGINKSEHPRDFKQVLHLKRQLMIKSNKKAVRSSLRLLSKRLVKEALSKMYLEASLRVRVDTRSIVAELDHLSGTSLD